jgi:hypothetical protein
MPRDEPGLRLLGPVDRGTLLQPPSG